MAGVGDPGHPMYMDEATLAKAFRAIRAHFAPTFWVCQFCGAGNGDERLACRYCQRPRSTFPPIEPGPQEPSSPSHSGPSRQT